MSQQYPSHENQIQRLNKIEGQVKGIRKMIEDQRYCIDILHQIKAVKSALKQVELNVLETHIHHCVQETLEAKDSVETQKKIAEIMHLVGKIP